MSGSDASDEDPPAVAAEQAVAEEQADEGPAVLDAEGTTAYLQWGLLALLVLFALVAAVSLYGNVGHIIRVWVAEDYRPIFNAAFNLVVILVAAAGIVTLLRRLR